MSKKKHREMRSYRDRSRMGTACRQQQQQQQQHEHQRVCCVRVVYGTCNIYSQFPTQRLGHIPYPKCLYVARAACHVADAIRYTTVNIAPPSGGFSSSIARQPRGCQYTRTAPLWKAPDEMLPTLIFLGGSGTIPTAVEISTMGNRPRGVS